jgi:signal transduction histidine kinase
LVKFINNKELTVLLFIVLLICVPAKRMLSQNSESNLKTKNILILFALEPGTPVYDKIFDNIKSHLRRNYPNPLNFCVEYLQLSRFADDKHVSEFFEYFNKKYETSGFDLFITIGPNVNPYIEKFCSPYTEKLPRVSLDFSYPPYNQKDTLKGKNEAFINIDLDFEKNIQTALNILPDTKNIFLVAGSSAMDMRMLKNYALFTDKLSGKIKITILSGLPFKNLINQLSSLPEKSIVFMPTYQQDSLGASYYGAEIIRLVNNYTKAPIFTLFDAAMGGTIGGSLISTSAIGEKISETSIRILNGENTESIATYHSDFNKYIFEWKQLRKWNISEKNLPAGSVVLNREYTFFEVYYIYMIFAFVFMMLETLLLIYIIYLYRTQKKQAVIIKNQENRYKELVDFNKLLELSEITASLSHQLNQPLTAILSSSQASLRFLKNEDYNKQIIEEILNNIVEDVKRASEIIISLRNMLKKEDKELKRININKCILDVYNLFISQASIHDIILESDFDEKEPFVLANSTLIQQVILNLLLNASEELQNKTGGNKKIFLKTEVLDGCIKTSVSDTGKGIGEDLRKDIFKPFFTTKSNGLGIGLAICRSIIEDHSGKLSYETNENGGATFSFNLKTVK